MMPSSTVEVPAAGVVGVEGDDIDTAVQWNDGDKNTVIMSTRKRKKDNERDVQFGTIVKGLPSKNREESKTALKKRTNKQTKDGSE